MYYLKLMSSKFICICLKKTEDWLTVEHWLISGLGHRLLVACIQCPNTILEAYQMLLFFSFFFYLTNKKYKYKDDSSGQILVNLLILRVYPFILGKNTGLTGLTLNGVCHLMKEKKYKCEHESLSLIHSCNNKAHT